MKRWGSFALVVLGATVALGPARAPGAAPGRESAAERGRRNLLTRSYIPASWPLDAYEKAWRHWGLEKKPAPAEYDRLFRARYGLHPAPYPNGGYPMGLRVADRALGRGKGLTVDCLVCHGGSILGTSYVGLGNSSLDYQALYEELGGYSGKRARPPFTFSNVRGTSEAGAMSVFLLGFREPDLGVRLSRLDLGLHDDMCEDVPAWWLLKKKRTMYHTGGADTRSHRSLMQFMLTPLNFPAAFHRAEPDFKDILAYLRSLEPPKYPLPVDRERARAGEKVFRANCSRCHGTYGEKWTYPNKVVPVDEIGTDRRRFDGITRTFGEYYARSWFAGDYKPLPSKGYQAPPLDGIWATAPYLHNGSVPTVYHLLKSKTRPKVFTRSFRTDIDSYDPEKLGWKVRVLDRPPDPRRTPPAEFRKVYDTTRPGRGNAGHTYGDKLSESERRAVIEYLKTL